MGIWGRLLLFWCCFMVLIFIAESGQGPSKSASSYPLWGVRMEWATMTCLWAFIKVLLNAHRHVKFFFSLTESKCDDFTYLNASRPEQVLEMLKILMWDQRCRALLPGWKKMMEAACSLKMDWISGNIYKKYKKNHVATRGFLNNAPLELLQARIQWQIITYLPGPRRSLISMFREGKNWFPQKGHVVLRLESSAVQPAMISSSCTRQSQVWHREQLEMRTCGKHFIKALSAAFAPVAREIPSHTKLQ